MFTLLAESTTTSAAAAAASTSSSTARLAPRLGLFHLRSSNSTLQTPTCLLPTRRATVPHLTPDMVTHLTNTAKENTTMGIQLQLDFLLELFLQSSIITEDTKPASGNNNIRRSTNSNNNNNNNNINTSNNDSVHEKVNNTLHPRKFLNNEHLFVFATPRDPFNSSPGCTDSHMLVQTWTGRQQITPRQYMDCVNALEVEGVASMSDMISSVGISESRARKSVDRTLRFLDQCIPMKTPNVNMYGVLNGGKFPSQRKRSAEETIKRNAHLAGFVVDGLGAGENPQDFPQLLQESLMSLPEDKPRLIQGITSPITILEAISLGVDLFDAGYPLLLTEAGNAISFNFTHDFESSELTPTSFLLNLWDPIYSTDKSPILPRCACFACKNHTRGYIHHLLNVRELLASVLLMSHNCHQYLMFFQDIRSCIQKGNFEEKKRRFLEFYKS